MTDHSILPPSSAARRMACPGSRALEALYPQEDSPYAIEGRLAHELAASLLKLKIKDDGLLHDYSQTYTEEMLEGANLYADHVSKIICRHQLIIYKIEQRVNIERIHPDCWGTPDCWAYDPDIEELFIFDYKFGHGFVDVFENWQLIEYAAGAIGKLFNTAPPIRKFNFCIIQPRSYHKDGPIRYWSITPQELEIYITRLQETEQKAMEPNAQCIPNPECTYCVGRHACQALQQAALTVVDISKSNTPWELSPADLGKELKLLKNAAELLDARITGLEEQVLSKIQSGVRVPHFKVEPSIGREKWKVPVNAIEIMGVLFGCDLLKPKEAITPKQAIKAGVPESIVKNYVEVQHGKLKLVPEPLNLARKIFGKK